jgi:hypothetical protein
MSNALNVDINYQDNMKAWLSYRPDTVSVAGFVAGPGIQKLDLKFDIEKLRQPRSLSDLGNRSEGKSF